MSDTQRCAERIREIYGDDLSGRAGVLHVIAVWAPPGGSARVIRIGPRAPRSPTDAFVLRLARARADAIVTTGRSLREEPRVTHRIAGAPELLAWRAEVLGRSRLPRSLVLSSGRDLDLDHPLFRAADHPILFTREDAPESLDAEASTRGIDLVRHAAPDIRRAVDFLRDGRGAGTVSIEAGPSTALALYEPPLAVDELMLSTFEGPSLDEEARGSPFPDLARLASLLPNASRPYEIDESSGRWTFRRLWRDGR